MEAANHVESIRRHGARLATGADGALDRPVPSCPGWDLAELVWHTGTVHAFWRALAAGTITAPDRFVARERPADAELVAWFRAGVEELVTTLAPLDPATPRWTWAEGAQHAGFIQRRMAQETAVHGWDAVAATGTPQPIEAELAVDGIDEFLDHFLELDGGDLARPPTVVHLHATDADGEWVIRLGDGTVAVERAHARGDVAVRAPASDLLLLLWKRVTADVLEVHGDPAALERLFAAASVE